MNESLRRQSWYLGEIDQEAAASVLTASDIPDAYVVYSSPDNPAKYTLSIKTQVPDSKDPVIKHLHISSPHEGLYQLPGYNTIFRDVTELVANYVTSYDPPLSPALKGRTNFEVEFTVSGKPPEYNRINIELKPEIAELPNIDSIEINEDEDSISSSSSLLRNPRLHPVWYNQGGEGVVQRGGGGGNGSYDRELVIQWRRFPDRHLCHPKNCCYGCCYRPHYNEYITPYRRYGATGRSRILNYSQHSEVQVKHYPYEWYNPRGSGPLRILGLLVLYLLCCPCFFCYLVFCCP